MPDLTFENQLRARGLNRIAGVDEAGRGPLAGPVSAAAVVLPMGFDCPGLDDSKRLTEKKREALFEKLTTDADILWSHAFVDAGEIDEINILKATHLAMSRAVGALSETPDFCLIDGLPVPGFAWPSEAVVKGDAKSLSIAAASIIAKVARDRLMLEHAIEFPHYGFERHKGYGTKEHLAALRDHGPCRIHRRSFQPVAQRLLPLDEA
jgi:ribonuclease HII